MNDEFFMTLAVEEAIKAYKENEVPVGAIIVKDGKVIAKGHNKRETLNSPIAHAEIIAIEEASRQLKNWRLYGCELYVTLEPCPMCAGAILQSRIAKLHIGTFDENTGACGSVINIVQNYNLNHFLEVKWHHDYRCSEILRKFFQLRRG